MDTDDLHMVLGEIRSDVKTLLQKDGDYEKRLRALEKWRWIAHGATMFLGAVAMKLGLPYLPH